MELRQLAYFVAVAEEHNFTRAAERIPIAQPVISQRIRRLEAELGEHLFVRDRRGARLTPAGQALLPHARTTLQARRCRRDAGGCLSSRCRVDGGSAEGSSNLGADTRRRGDSAPAERIA